MLLLRIWLALRDNGGSTPAFLIRLGTCCRCNRSSTAEDRPCTDTRFRQALGLGLLQRMLYDHRVCTQCIAIRPEGDGLVVTLAGIFSKGTPETVLHLGEERSYHLIPGGDRVARSSCRTKGMVETRIAAHTHAPGCELVIERSLRGGTLLHERMAIRSLSTQRELLQCTRVYERAPPC